MIDNVVFPAERAAHHRAFDVNLALRAAHKLSHEAAYAVRVLNGAGDNQATIGRIKPGQYDFRFDVGVFLEAHFIFTFNHVTGFGKAFGDVAFNGVVMSGDIIAALRVNSPGVRRQRGFYVR